jgi:hypothetical protein
MNYLIWDFDGTLSYREGMWSGTLFEILCRDLMEVVAMLEREKVATLNSGKV